VTASARPGVSMRLGAADPDPRVCRLIALAAGCAGGAMVGSTSRWPRSHWGVAVAWALAVVIGWRLLARPAGIRVLVAGWLIVGLLVAGGNAARHAARLVDSPLTRLASGRADVDAGLRLTRDPLEVTTHHGQRMWLIDATVVWIRTAGTAKLPIDRPALVFGFSRSWSGLLPGQQVRVSGRLAAPRPGDTVTAVVDARSPPVPVGRPPWWQRTAARVRGALADACAGLPPATRALVPALVLGVVTPLPAGLKQQFQVTGLSHLVAVSGENLGILFVAVLWLVRAVGLPRRLRILALLLTVAGFVVVARPSPSVLRAAAMGAVAVGAVVTGRRRKPLPGLALAVAVLLVADPALVRQLGFQLSVAATAGIVLLAPPIAARLSRWLPRRLALLVAVPAAAQAACTPLLLGSFGQLTPYAIPANLAAGLAVPAATLIGVVVAAVAVVAPPVGACLARLAALPAAWIIQCARWFAGLPGAAARLPGWEGAVGTAALLAVLLVLVLVRRRRAGPCDP
jgi:competence protein ComEC